VTHVESHLSIHRKVLPWLKSIPATFAGSPDNLRKEIIHAQ